MKITLRKPYPRELAVVASISLIALLAWACWPVDRGIRLDAVVTGHRHKAAWTQYRPPLKVGDVSVPQSPIQHPERWYLLLRVEWSESDPTKDSESVGETVWNNTEIGSHR